MAKKVSAKAGKHVTINVDPPDDIRRSGAGRDSLASTKAALRQPLIAPKPLRQSSSCQMLGDALAQYVHSDEEDKATDSSNSDFESDFPHPSSRKKSNGVDPEASQKRRLLRARTAPILARGTSIHKVKQKKVTRARVMMLQAAVALLVYLFLGMLTYALQRDEFRGVTTHPVIDSMYFSMVTMTTTGYGDLVPFTKKAKLFASLFAFAGLVLFGVLISGAGHYLIDKQERLLLEAARRRLDRGNEFSGGEFTPADQAPTGENKYWKLLRAGTYIGGALATGMIVLMKVEGMDWVDALYCACVSVSSIGYGDRSFRTPFGRLFATFWLLLSVLTVAKSITLIAEARLESRQKKFVKEVLCKGLTSTDFQAADIDNDGTVGLAEFAIFKLREMGKIEPDDLNQIRAQYQKLDIDDRGRLHIQSLPDYY
ncbi:Tandem pore domain K+ channel [Klebsormidium nitens]|uniref:Tandem pore domain K+ channel n=1 Tax=Klebsormidium nitens TaxID=105231 RepID=A0A1Y1HUH6_KLENI|nr:Tandem pore domain K+ channel [Klebsormidium nitens]|eukprot:GAQ82285.1 Tandem pore domain K+ channel [Klebsormidium nitens]